MMRNKYFRTVLSRLFQVQLGSNHPIVMFQRQRGLFSVKRRLPPPLGCRGLATHQSVPAPWHDGEIIVATAISAGVIYAVARVTYGETEPYTGHTHLALLSHQEARKRDDARFAKYKKEHAREILSPSHPDTVRVRGIAQKIIHAAHHGLAIRQLHTPSSRPMDGLKWMDGLDWEVVVLRNDHSNAEAFPAAGKIVIYTGTLEHLKNDVEIAVTIAHEVGHVIARHSSGIIYWLDFEIIPILILVILLFFPFILPYKRRCELQADHIGMMLLAAAGVDPITAILVRQKKAEIARESALTECLSYISTHPSNKKRVRFLSQPKVMDEALELYKRVISRHTRLG